MDSVRYIGHLRRLQYLGQHRLCILPTRPPQPLFVVTETVALILANPLVSGGSFQKFSTFQLCLNGLSKSSKVHILKDIVDHFDGNFDIPFDSPESDSEVFKEYCWDMKFNETLNLLE